MLLYSLSLPVAFASKPGSYFGFSADNLEELEDSGLLRAMDEVRTAVPPEGHAEDPFDCWLVLCAARPVGGSRK
jgi:hypothetical protein